jgi:FkbM family methyltransferase
MIRRSAIDGVNLGHGDWQTNMVGGRAIRLAKRLYRRHANLYPGLFHWQQRLVADGRRRLGLVHEEDFKGLPVLGLTKASTCIDIGANFGQSIGSLCAVLGAPRIVAFEPNPIAYAHLAKIARRSDKVTVYNYALGESPGELHLHIPQCGGVILDQFATIGTVQLDEIIDTYIKAGYAFAATSPMQIIDYLVLVKRLDEFGLAPDFIKIDVESSELQVLCGAESTIRKSLPILMIENGERPEIISWLTALSYHRYVFGEGRLKRTDTGPALNSFYVHSSRSVL